MMGAKPKKPGCIKEKEEPSERPGGKAWEISEQVGRDLQAENHRLN